MVLMEELVFGEGNIVWAHNASFEIAISRYLWESTFGFPPPRLEQWRCTQALCRVTAIPSSLAQAAEFLHLPIKKDKMGSSLIAQFCVPPFLDVSNPKPVTIAKEKILAKDAWNKFREYCRTDVATEREIEKKL